MARTISAIQAAIAADRQACPELAGLSSLSARAIYRLSEYVVAVAHWALETLWDRFRADVDAVIAAAPPGTAGWYAARAMEFQQGDPLTLLATGRAAGPTCGASLWWATTKPAPTTARWATRAGRPACA